MKIVFLNVLDAQLLDPLREFLLTHAADTDVFCLQESYHNARPLLNELFHDYAKISATKQMADRDDYFANVTLVRNDWSIEESRTNVTTEDTGLTLCTSIRRDGTLVHIANVHGLSQPGKSDNPDRLRQSNELIAMLAQFSGTRIIGGDLNVLPETNSVGLIESAGYRNLIKDYRIETTRNELAWSKYPGNELLFSDYVFVQECRVDSFAVPSDIVSDHQPMIVQLIGTP